MSAIGARVMGTRVVDLFGGSGALGLEALSRGATSVVFVEKARPAFEALRANIEALGAQEETTVVRADAVRYARKLGRGAFDLALADPPYDRGLASELVRIYAASPFASEFWVEHRSDERLPSVPGAVARRYGGTTLTVFRRDDDGD